MAVFGTVMLVSGISMWRDRSILFERGHVVTTEVAELHSGNRGTSVTVRFTTTAGEVVETRMKDPPVFTRWLVPAVVLCCWRWSLSASGGGRVDQARREQQRQERAAGLEHADTSTMTARSHWGVTPRQSIEAECARRGTQAVVAGCCTLVKGGEADSALILALGGPPARRLLDRDPRADQRYWLRVWGIRGLLWAWDDAAGEAVTIALHDPAWRVRELAAKVVARHYLGDMLSVVDKLRDDPVPRVRAAATRAIAILTRARA